MDDKEEDNTEKDKDTLEKEEVKSTAIVKYSVPKPAQFAKLKCNTDLNLPPSNWLSSSADSYGLQHVLYHQTGFSSFRMAHMFPDCVGEVDVVSDAENIKNLLKIPYQKGHISMLVHRIENTLLLDDFDIYKHLLRTAESDWSWLRDFFYKNINRESYEEDKNLYVKNRQREALKQRSLVSKFLYHSLVEDDQNTHAELDNPNNYPLVDGPILPDPEVETPDSSASDHKYNRNVVWTFEDIEMLIGTDLPIFGGGTHPCISLRLRDATKPINVLTGIDYWLDNLMSNVPEVVMCYHLNGIVQKYELIKTEDLPRLDNSKFSPKLIRDVAQSILSFLKSNATKAGHTYWLFKAKDEEVVKLYDLTSLCTEKDVENGQNPFTIPVAMLLYRVARNMKHTSDRQPGTIRMLLKNSIKLLPEEKYPEIVTSSHFMLSDLYIPAGTNPESPGFEQTDSDENSSVYEDDEDEYEDLHDSAKVLVLNSSLPYNKTYTHKSPPPIIGTVEERCLQSLQHIIAGLKCLKHFAIDNPKQQEEEVKMAKPFEPIPMPYAKLNDVQEQNKKTTKKQKGKRKEKKTNTTNALLLKNKNEAQPIPTWQNPNMSTVEWKLHLKTLLYEKAVLVYAIMAETCYVQHNYGHSMRNIGLFARCQLVMDRLYATNALKVNWLLARAGDCCIMLVQNWNCIETHREQFQNYGDEDLKMMELLELDETLYDISIGDSYVKCVFLYDFRTIEQILLKSIECYEAALKCHEDDTILKRLGNSLNEVASHYLFKAKTAKTIDETTEMCQKAEEYLQKGLEHFDKIKDDANMALLYANMGHLHRILAHANTPVERVELTNKEKLHYNKALLNYSKAMQVLGKRDTNPGIWDSVKWEMCTSLFNMGCIMHENPSVLLSKAEAEREVISTLQKALSYCDFDEENPKFPLYQYRAAVIHYRIASLYHSHIWNSTSDSSNRKNIIQLAKINYEKASKWYLHSLDSINYLTSQMQRVALSEYLAETANMPNMKIKHFQNCLDTLIETKVLMELFKEKKLDIPADSLEDDGNNFKTCKSLLNLALKRLQHVLKNLIKLCLTTPSPNKNCHKLADLYKYCYKLSLGLKESVVFNDFILKFYDLLDAIDGKMKEFKDELER